MDKFSNLALLEEIDSNECFIAKWQGEIDTYELERGSDNDAMRFQEELVSEAKAENLELGYQLR